jgi:hypothetical protein
VFWVAATAAVNDTAIAYALDEQKKHMLEEVQWLIEMGTTRPWELDIG